MAISLILQYLLTADGLNYLVRMKQFIKQKTEPVSVLFRQFAIVGLNDACIFLDSFSRCSGVN